MAHSLKNQMQYAINSNWHEGAKKKDYKTQNGNTMSAKIFSYSEAFRLKDISKDFANFIKKEYPYIKQIKDIPPNAIQDFLNSKEHCSKQTITLYYNSLKKMDLLLTHTYKTYQSKFVDIVKPLSTQGKNYSSGRGVANQIPMEDLQKILDYCKSHPCQSSYIIRLQSILGLRINELTHGIKISNLNLTKNQLTITNTKGGKILVREISAKTSAIIQEALTHKYDAKGKQLFTIENNSVNRFLSRIESKIEIDGKYSTHNIRARVAQNYYDDLRNKGFSKNNALQETSIFLNHRTQREQMLTKSYVNIW